ncbi:MAG TPA: HD domain-containing phosphohydrolase [Terriglobales bacterium]|nr:HD domain-containing phosphohydrolase [Terriglobales bacterium]
MSTAKVSSSIPRSGPNFRNLPAVVFFEGDDVAKTAIQGLSHFLRLEFHEFANGRESETVLVTSLERMILEKAGMLRAPNVRVIALSDWRFKDPRTDAVVYAYLPVKTPPGLVERTIDNALDHIHLLATRRDVNEKLAGATKEIQELNAIGAALSAEHDTEKLLEMILSKSREITKADAGSLYLIEEQVVAAEGGQPLATEKEVVIGGAKLAARPRVNTRKVLRFKLAQNDSVNIPFREAAVEVSDESIAGYVARSGDSVNLEDAYHLPEGVPYKINRKFDEDSGYRTKSILAIPMRNQKGEIVGVLQLINAKRQWSTKLTTVKAVANDVIPFAFRLQELVTSLASQAAVALENSRLYEAIQRLFEGFVKASVTAIEARDPTTSGHSFRVANLTVALAEAVNRAENGVYQDVKFSRDQMREIRYASLLHDFGKVGVREDVLVKAKKLYPLQLDLIFRRFQYAKRTAETDLLKQQLQLLLHEGKNAFEKNSPELTSEFKKELARLDEEYRTIAGWNEPALLPEGDFERLHVIAQRTVPEMNGAPLRLLQEDEVRLLSIRKGSLDDAERRQIESHVVHTFNFLQQIPWTGELKSIPEIARGHHEKLTGDGYPYKLSANEIPLQTRMMTISDIYDALSASDRPYKPAVDNHRALGILEQAVKDGELDRNLFQLFLDAKVYEKWKVEPHPY